MDFVLNGIDQADDADDIRACLHNLFSTPAGTIAGDRDFGLSWAALDSVPSELEPTYSLEIMEKVDRYEPRMSVTEVVFAWSEEGPVVNVYLDRKENTNNGR